MFPSNDAMRIVKTAEIVFKEVVVGGTYDCPSITAEKKLMLRLKIKTIRILPKNLFSGLRCDYENEIVREDLHSSQLTKE